MTRLQRRLLLIAGLAFWATGPSQAAPLQDSSQISPDKKNVRLDHSTTLVWDLTPSTWRPDLTARASAPQDLDSLWTDLATQDALRAYAAIWTFANTPKVSVPFLRKRLRPTSAVAPERLAQLLADLDR